MQIPFQRSSVPAMLLAAAMVPFLFASERLVAQQEVVEEVDLHAGRIRVSWWDDER